MSRPLFKSAVAWPLADGAALIVPLAKPRRQAGYILTGCSKLYFIEKKVSNKLF